MIIARRSFLGFIGLGLAGGTVGPDYLKPDVTTPEMFRYQINTGKAYANESWWQLFSDRVLHRLVNQSLAQNWDITIATARVEEAAGVLITRGAPLYPQVGYNGLGQRERLSNKLPGATTSISPNPQSLYEPLFTASWEIDLWGRIRRESEAARARLMSTEEGKQGVVLTLVAGVAGSYINLRDLDRQLEIAVNTANAREASYKIFQDRYTGGVISLLELNQNKSQYEEALATIPKFEKEIAQQENALSVLLGRNPGPIARGNNIDQLRVPAVPEGLPSTLLERRPDVRGAEQDLIARNALIGAAKAAYFPSISLTALFGVASSSLSSLFSSGSQAWQYGGALSQPIFTGGLLAGQVEVAEAQQQQSLFAYQKTVQNAFREVNDALIDIDRTRAQLAAQRLQVQSLQVYADTARLRYDNGYTSYIEVLDAERSLFNAQLQYTQTQQTQLQASINLYKAMGGGWVTEAAKLTTK